MVPIHGARLLRRFGVIGLATAATAALTPPLPAVAQNSAPASPTSVTVAVEAEADTFVDQGSPRQRWGETQVLKVGSSPRRVAYLRFRVPSTLLGISSVTLRLWVLNASPNAGRLHQVDNLWSEATMNWRNRPAVGAPLGSLGRARGGTWIEADVSSAITGPGTYSMAVVSPSTDPAWFTSREGQAGERPHLLVEAAAVDEDPPSVPTGVEASAVSPVRIDLTWEPSTDDGAGVASYEVYRDGVHVATVTDQSYQDGGLQPETSYDYRVRAVDGAGNESALTDPVAETTPASMLQLTPVADTYVSEGEPTQSFGTAPELSVDNDPRYVSYLRFVVPPDTDWFHVARLHLSPLDHQDAGSPNGGTLFAVANDGWSEELIWPERPIVGEALAPIGSVVVGTTEVLDVTGHVTGPGPYSFAIETSHSNGSDYTSREGLPAAQQPRLVLEADLEDPSVPQGLTAEAQSSVRVDLRWTASTDDVGVTGYEVFRDGTEIATTDATRFIDTLATPNATHQYTVRAFDRAGNRSGHSAAGTATTPIGPSFPVIAAVGDIACDPADEAYNDGNGTDTRCRHRATSDLVVGQDYSGVLALGDTQYEQGALAAYQQSYDPAWGRVRDITFPVPGDREYRTSGAAGYFGYFGELAGDPAKGYYSFDLGTWHVVGLNTECFQLPGGDDGGCAAGSPQEQWLRQDLAAHPAQCTLAFWHRPLYASHAVSIDSSIPFWQALEEAGAEVVLNGDAHAYERFAPQDAEGNLDPNGIREFISGGGGKVLHSFGNIHPHSEFRYNLRFGILELTLRPGAYDWRFVNELGSVVDPGTAACH